MHLTIPERPGQCRWCGCTEDHACAGGCAWANSAQTLCSACVPLDRHLRTRGGRRTVAEVLQGVLSEGAPR